MNIDPPSEDLAPLPAIPPDCLARFEPLRVLASGGFGIVILARQRALDRPAALKLLLADPLEQEDQLARFLAEARVTAALSHRHIVTVLDHGAETGIPWIACEYVAGSNLRARLERGPLPAAEALEAAAQVADALAAAHAGGVVHRDIKPDNVLEAHSNHFKVVDFGIAHWQGNRAIRTQAGLILGTPAYISPEQVRGEPASGASDIYSLGVMLFELLAGRVPFVDENPYRVLQRHLTSPVPRLSGLRPGLPRAVEDLLDHALAKSPADRIGTAVMMRDRLRELVTTPIHGFHARPGPASGDEERGERNATRPVRRTGAPSTGLRIPPEGGPIAPARPERRSRWPVRSTTTAALAFVLLGVIGITHGLRSPRKDRPPPTGAPEPRTLHTTSVTVLPDFLRVTAGSDRMRIWFTAPVPGGSRVIMRRLEEGPGDPREHGCPAGTTYQEILGLPPGTDFEVRLFPDGAPVRRIRTATRGLEAPGELQLGPLPGVDRSRSRSLALAVNGKQVLLAWGRKGGSVWISSSPDEGWTWSAPERVSGRAPTLTAVTAAPAGTGFLLGWVEPTPAGGRRGRFLVKTLVTDQPGAGTLRELGPTAPGDCNPVLLRLPDGRVLCAWAGVRGIRSAILTDDGTTSPDTFLLPHGPDELTAIPVGDGDVLLVLTDHPPDQDPRQLRAIRYGPGSGRAPPGPTPVTDEGRTEGRLGDVTVTAHENRVILGYQIGVSGEDRAWNGVRLRRSADGGRTFGPPTDLPPLGAQAVRLPTLLAGPGARTWLAAVTWQGDFSRGSYSALEVLSSVDGVSWPSDSRQVRQLVATTHRDADALSMAWVGDRLLVAVGVRDREIALHRIDPDLPVPGAHAPARIPGRTSRRGRAARPPGAPGSSSRTGAGR